MTPDAYLLAFACSFLGCVLSTPIVTRLAIRAGAIDRPDQFRRVHKGATPRMGGLGLAAGILAGVGAMALIAPQRPELIGWLTTLGWVAVAGSTVLAVGLLDDTIGLGPRPKLLGQALAVAALYAGGIRIDAVEFLGIELPLHLPEIARLPGWAGAIAAHAPSIAASLFWFLGCMNIWNLIDGMDGLASGVGLLVAATMMLVSLSLGNFGSAILAAALAGGLAGFLLYNWHPATIFLGDCGSLLIGMLIGVIGIQGSLKGAVTVSILLPILAMGLPISDTALAIFRRWVRNLPLTAADRRHVHHLLIGLGLNPRQAAAMLYCFTTFLCGAVLLGVVVRSDVLALGLGVAGCLAFVVVLYSRRDEFEQLTGDLAARFTRGRMEGRASQLTWEAIQRVELCDDSFAVLRCIADAAAALGCPGCRCREHRPAGASLRLEQGDWSPPEAGHPPGLRTFVRIEGGGDASLVVECLLDSRGDFADDIAYRSLSRLCLASAARLARLRSGQSDVASPASFGSGPIPRAEGIATIHLASMVPDTARRYT